MDAPFAFNLFKNNKIHYRALSIVYRDSNWSFEYMLEKSGSVTIHPRNLQFLAVEIFKALNNLSPSFMSKLFEIKDMKYELHDGRNLRLSLPHTSTHDINSYLAANIWTHVPLENKQCKSLSLFKQIIKTWIPEVFPCKLCKTYIHHASSLWSEMFLTSCIFINIIGCYICIYSIQNIRIFVEYYC